MKNCFLCRKEITEQNKGVEVTHMNNEKVIICERHPHPKEEVN